MESIDLNTISDIKELKSMFFDQTVIIERAQNNRQAILERISVVEQTPEPKK